jgi:hypothetical protein
MTNLIRPTQIPTKILNNNFTPNQIKVLKLILNPPKKFALFNKDDLNKLSKVIIRMAQLLGINNPPNKDIRKFITTSIVEHYPNLTLEDFMIGIQLCAMGKLDMDNNHYQNLTPMYVSNILSSYLEYRRKTYLKYKNKLDIMETNKKINIPSEKEQINISVNLIQAEYNDYMKSSGRYVVSTFRDSIYKYIYEFLYKYNFIQDKQNKNKMLYKKASIDFFKTMEDKKVTNVKEYLKNNWKNK